MRIKYKNEIIDKKPEVDKDVFIAYLNELLRAYNEVFDGMMIEGTFNYDIESIFNLPDTTEVEMLSLSVDQWRVIYKQNLKQFIDEILEKNSVLIERLFTYENNAEIYSEIGDFVENFARVMSVFADLIDLEEEKAEAFSAMGETLYLTLERLNKDVIILDRIKIADILSYDIQVVLESVQQLL